MTPTSTSFGGRRPALCRTGGGVRFGRTAAGFQFPEQHSGENRLARFAGIDRPGPHGAKLHQKTGGDFAERGGV